MDRLHTIPNVLSIGLAAAYYAWAVATGVPASEIIDHTVAGAVILVVLAVASLNGMMGGGIAKLATAAFVWFGFWTGLGFFAVSMLLCAATGLLMQAVRAREVTLPYLPFAAVTAALIVLLPEFQRVLAS